MDSETKKFFEELTGEDEGAETKVKKTSAKTKDIEIDKEDLDESLNQAQDLSDEREGQLAIDVYQDANSIIVESPIAGVDADGLDIHITSESVTIKGRRVRKNEIKDEDYFYQECYWGRFSRSIILPQEVDAEGAEASIKNGVLRIIMPKLNRHRGKKLKVKID